MKKISPYKYILLVLAVVFCAGYFLRAKPFLAPSTPKEEVPIVQKAAAEPVVPAAKIVPSITPSKKPETQTATLIAGTTRINLPFAPGETLYSALVAAKNTGLVFAGKEYPALGFFVTDIGSLHQTSGGNLMYFINGKEAAVGVSTYVLVNGDVIEWKVQ